MPRFARLLVLTSLLAAGCGARAPEGSAVLFAGRLYLAPDRPPMDDAAVLWRDGIIVAVGARDAVASRGAARLEACDGGVVTAGFYNSHVHFTGPQWDDAATRPAKALQESLEEMLTRYGFTTVMDTASRIGNTAALRRRIERGGIAGPRILTAGGALYPRDGIPFYLREMPPRFLAELHQPANVEAALAAVKHNLDAGADATKLFVMTPVGGGRVAFMHPDIARAASDETHRRGLPVLAHPTDIEGIELAIEAGVDVLVHTTIGNGKTVWDEALVAQLVSADIAVIPTLMLWPYELRRAGLPEAVVEAATADAVEQSRAFAAAGGQLLFGTDVGYMADYNPTEEYRLMARALSPMQILAALTTNPAARWRGDAQEGWIAEGRAADLVVLESDPADDPERFAGVRCTIRAGRLLYHAASAH